MSSLPPVPPPGIPPQPGAAANHAPWPAGTAGHAAGPAAGPRESRGVAFFVAIFLGLLLIASAGLNVLLLLVSVGSLAGGGFGDFDAPADEVYIAGTKTSREKVLQVPIRGAIAEGANPVLGAGGGTVTQVKRALRQAAESDIRGLLLLIDSPGGGVTDSEEIHAMLLTFRREHPGKPVLALFGDMAASGGYYIAVAAEHIIARRTTITGSIGVIMSAWNFAEAAHKLGIDQVAIKSDRTPLKDILSPMRAMSDEERALLTAIVDEMYERFVTVVEEGRPQLTREQVYALATGAVYTGNQAQKNGLVDEVGDLESAVRWFDGRLGKPVQLVERRRRPGLADLLFSSRGPSDLQQWGPQLLAASTGPRFLYYWQGGR